MGFLVLPCVGIVWGQKQMCHLRVGYFNCVRELGVAKKLSLVSFGQRVGFWRLARVCFFVRLHGKSN
jgi:hypothetical protein